MHYFYDDSTIHKPLRRLLHMSSYKFFSLCSLDLCHLKQDGVAPTYTCSTPSTSAAPFAFVLHMFSLIFVSVERGKIWGTDRPIWICSGIAHQPDRNPNLLSG